MITDTVTTRFFPIHLRVEKIPGSERSVPLVVVLGLEVVLGCQCVFGLIGNSEIDSPSLLVSGSEDEPDIVMFKEFLRMKSPLVP